MASAVSCQLLLNDDDSALLVPGDSTQQIESELQSELNSLHEWLVDNKLSLHLGKTETILFGTEQTLKRITALSIQCHGHTLASKSIVKYLAVDLDQALTVDTIARKALNKINNGLKFLFRNKSKFDMDIKKNC